MVSGFDTGHLEFTFNRAAASPKKRQDMNVNLKNVSIVLQRPRFPENIGSAARVIKNMGLNKLIVNNPEDCDLTRILKMATVNAIDVVEEMELYHDLREALSPFQYIVGTTARTGTRRQTLRNPRALARELIPITAENRVAILFGPEDRGLANRELKYCNNLVTIPTSREDPSLNVSQAVMVIAYELFMASIDDPPVFVPKVANSHEMEAMYDQLGTALARIGFIHPQNPAYWMMHLRRFFNRVQLKAREANLLLAVCRQFNWYWEHKIQPALDAHGAEGKNDPGDAAEVEDVQQGGKE